MSGVNKVIIVGRLGNDPELKQINADNSVCNFSIATSESWKDKSGEKKEKTEWHKIVVWGKLAEISSKYLSKGRQVYIEGKLQTRSWETDDGVKRYTTEIVATNVQFLAGATNEASEQTKIASPLPADPVPNFDSTDELPF